LSFAYLVMFKVGTFVHNNNVRGTPIYTYVRILFVLLWVRIRENDYSQYSRTDRYFSSFFSYFVRDVISSAFVCILYKNNRCRGNLARLLFFPAITQPFYRLHIRRYIDIAYNASQAPVNNPYALYMALAVCIIL